MASSLGQRAGGSSSSEKRLDSAVASGVAGVWSPELAGVWATDGGLLLFNPVRDLACLVFIGLFIDLQLEHNQTMPEGRSELEGRVSALSMN